MEAEKCFSNAGLLITKLRSSKSEYMIDISCFMRSHLNEKNFLVYLIIWFEKPKLFVV